MKTFIFKIREGKSSYGVNYFVSVYSVKQNIPTFLFETKYNSGSYKGHVHQVFGELYSNGYITEKLYNKSCNKGYFFGDVTNFIQIIQL